VNKGFVDIRYLVIELMTADALTKALQSILFRTHRDDISVAFILFRTHRDDIGVTFMLSLMFANEEATWLDLGLASATDRNV
jgi:hypothetical protein